MEILPEFDCHCHILPGLDDGAMDLEESLFLAAWLASHGYKRAVCTSHRTIAFPNTPSIVKEAAEKLRAALDDKGIGLKLIPSLEYRLIPETWPEARRKDWLLPWEGNHVLVECPIRDRTKMGNLDPFLEIRQLVRDGYQPVLAHPERYLWATDGDYKAFRDAGAEFQRNLGSVEGFYRAPVAVRAIWLKENGFYSFLGTDLHDTTYAKCFDKILLQ